MQWASENWFWLPLLIGWAVFMLAVDDEVDRALRARQAPPHLDDALNDLEKRSTRPFGTVKRHATRVRPRLPSLYRRLTATVNRRPSKPGLKIPKA